jgi:hypothetical protein
MKTPQEKAKELFDKFYIVCQEYTEEIQCSIQAKQCALIAVENEYHSLRELLFNLRSCKVIESDVVYLYRLQQLIDEEQEVKIEIEKL